MGQISPTGVCPGSILPSLRRSSRSGAVIGPTQSEPRPNISNRRQGSNNIHKIANTSLARRQDYAQRCPTNTAAPQIVSNLHRGSMNYRQPTPGLLNLAPQPPEYLLNIHCQWYYDALIGDSSPFLWPIECFYSLNSCVTCALLLKSNIRHEVLLQSYDNTLINPKD